MTDDEIALLKRYVDCSSGEYSDYVLAKIGLMENNKKLLAVDEILDRLDETLKHDYDYFVNGFNIVEEKVTQTYINFKLEEKND